MSSEFIRADLVFISSSFGNTDNNETICSKDDGFEML